MFFQNKKQIETELKIKTLELSLPALSSRLQKVETAHTIAHGEHVALENQFNTLINSVNKLNETSGDTNKTLARLDENISHNNASIEKIDAFVSKTQSAGWKMVMRIVIALLIATGGFVIGLWSDIISHFIK